jgi:hypothetical protein
MKLPLKFEQATRRIEMMLLEAQLIAVDAEEIIREVEEAHESSYADVDVLDRDGVLAERESFDRVCHAKILRSSASQLRCTLESEIRRLREKNPFELGNVRV